MTRQLREIIGRVQRGLPRLKAQPVNDWRVLGQLLFLVLVLALTTLSACLVTENKDFVGSTSPPIPVATSPPSPWRVPYGGDSDCAGALSMKFAATVLDPDVQSTLYARLYVNGAGYQPQMLERTGQTTRSFQQCVPHGDLSVPCSVVELFVSSDLGAVFTPPAAGVLDPSAKFGPIIRWTILGPASLNQADAKWSDCSPELKPDGGM